MIRYFSTFFIFVSISAAILAHGAHEIHEVMATQNGVATPNSISFSTLTTMDDWTLLTHEQQHDLAEKVISGSLLEMQRISEFLIQRYYPDKPISLHSTRNEVTDPLYSRAVLEHVAISTMGSTENILMLLPKSHPDFDDFVSDYLHLYPNSLDEIVKRSPGSKPILSRALSFDGKLLEFASQELKSDRAIVQLALQQSGDALFYASEDLQSDTTLQLLAAKKGHRILSKLSPSILNNSIALEAVRNNGLALQYLPSKFRSNRAIVMEAVKQNGLALQYASSQLRSDTNVVSAAVRSYPYAMKFASLDLRNNKRFVWSLIRDYPMIFYWLSPDLKKDEYLFKEVVRHSAVYFLDVPEFKTRLDLVTYASRFDARAFLVMPQEYATKAYEYYYEDGRYKRKSELLRAVEGYPHYYRFFPDYFLRDEDVIKSALRSDATQLRYVPKDLHTSRVVLDFVRHNEKSFFDLTEEAQAILLDDENFVAQNPVNWIDRASDRIKSNLNLMKRIVRKAPFVLPLMDKVLQEQLINDTEFAKSVLVMSSSIFPVLPLEYKEYLNSDRSIALKAVSADGNMLQYLNKEFKNDLEIAIKAVENRGEAIDYLSDEFRNDYKLVSIAINQSAFSFYKIPGKFQRDREIQRNVIRRDLGLLRTIYFSNDTQEFDDYFLRDVDLLAVRPVKATDSDDLLEAFILKSPDYFNRIPDYRKNHRLITAFMKANMVSVHLAGRQGYKDLPGNYLVTLPLR